MNNKIMVVDDEIDILKSLKNIFEKQRYEVITVESGEECLRQLEKGFRGIILMDIMMPKMDGWDTIKEIIKRDLIREVAIEIITGKGTKDHQKLEELYPYIYDYLTKPIDIKQLIESVRKCEIYLDAKKSKITTGT
ncbi:MAG: response regulator [Candidatus Thermoplasmatota archaeon]|jgi:DNA-binding NtrC family response regulator|nr:response regulator [Candidatus Thermoplasmatota archaeon]